MQQRQELRKAGLKITLPRLKILEILEDSAQRHLSAEALYKELIDQGEDIGLATVYRVLTQFEAAGLVTRHNFEGGHSVFELAKGEHHLSMPGLTAISDEAAGLLLPRIGGNLPELKTLSLETAKALAQTRGHLVLNSLTNLSDETATALTENAQNRGNLYLNGLTTITPDTARAICRREGDLYLNGLTMIPDEVLQALAEHRSPGYARPIVYLDGLTTLSDEGAGMLASWPKWSGELPRLTTLSERAATALASSRNFRGKLPAVKMLSVEAARALAQRKGNLSEVRSRMNP